MLNSSEERVKEKIEIQAKIKAYFGEDYSKVEILNCTAQFRQYLGRIMDKGESTSDKDKTEVIVWQIDFEQGKSCHKGITKGCIWTDWQEHSLER